MLRAAKAGDAEAVREALRAGARVACVDSYGATPLHIVTRASKNTAAAKLLLAAGAPLEARTLKGKQTPLHWAAGNKNPAGVTLLLAAGADVGAVCTGGLTALHCAVKYEGGHLGCAQALLGGAGSAGADALRAARCAEGKTPLEWVTGDSANAEALRAVLRSSAPRNPNTGVTALLAALATSPAPAAVAQQPPATQQPGPVAETNLRASSKAAADIMISYYVRESGIPGDSAVVELKRLLEMRGYTVFVGELAIEAGDSWRPMIQAGVEGCKAFVVLCSPSYGDSKWTAREIALADDLNKLIMPVWHSGPYPPKAARMVLGNTQRVPCGTMDAGYVAAGMSHEAVAAELADALASKGVLPSLSPQPPQT